MMRKFTKTEIKTLLAYDQDKQKLDKQIAAAIAGTAQFFNDMADDGLDNLDAFINNRTTIEEYRDLVKNEIEQLVKVLRNKHQLLALIDEHLELKQEVEGMNILANEEND